MKQNLEKLEEQVWILQNHADKIKEAYMRLKILDLLDKLEDKIHKVKDQVYEIELVINNK